MRYLLDTHVLLWLLGDVDAVPAEVRQTLADRSNDLLASAVSAMEVSTKVRIGKLDSARALVATWHARVAEINAAEWPLTSEAGLIAGQLQWDHRDPFDRLLAAQAIEGNLVLVTTDPAFQDLRGLRTLGW